MEEKIISLSSSFPTDELCWNINHFQSCPWGRVSWEIIYDDIDNTLNKKAERFNNDHLVNTDNNIERYNLYGFSHGV